MVTLGCSGVKMPTIISTNPYKGVNAHLHSIAQNPQESPTIWTSIHASHIGHIIDSLNAQLPPNYVARGEQALQIRSDDSGTISRPRPDGSIYRTTISVSTLNIGQSALSESIRLIPMDEFDADNFFPSATIRYATDSEMHGEPITRIELLSPYNKATGGGYEKYIANRRTALYSGTSLIELDYLHQSVSPLNGIPKYPHEDDSHPYTLAVTDMRGKHNPNWVMLVHVVDVDQPLPEKVNIPLADDDFLEFDFNAVYQHTFTIGRWGTNIDYTQIPRKFETYSTIDQTHIQTVMQHAKELADAK
jgi:hypothetical protein